MTVLRAALVVAAALVAACGGGPSSPRAAAFRIVADGPVTVEDGQPVALQVEENGRTQSSAQYGWTTSNPSVATVSPDGVVQAAGGYGEVIVTASTQAGASATARIWVQYPESRPSTYRITFVFADDVHPAWREAYAWAAERWARVIRSALPAYDLTGHSLCKFPAGIPPITGLETGTRVVVLSSPNSNSGGPCTRRTGRPTTALGVIEASHGASIDFDSPFTNLRGTAMHELGHVLGLAGITASIPGSAPWYDQQTSRYTGVFGLEGYRRRFGTSVAYIETRPGDWHWRGFNELMTSPPSGTITTVSVGALMDIGYPAAWYGAD